MDFVQPGLLGSWSDFRTTYERPIIEGSEEERETIVNRLLSEIKGYYLRRLKSDILTDLPPKNAIYREVGLSDEQILLDDLIKKKPEVLVITRVF